MSSLEFVDIKERISSVDAIKKYKNMQYLLNKLEVKDMFKMGIYSINDRKSDIDL